MHIKIKKQTKYIFIGEYVFIAHINVKKCSRKYIINEEKMKITLNVQMTILQLSFCFCFMAHIDLHKFSEFPFLE